MSSNRIIGILEDYLAWAQLDERVGGYKNLPQSERKKLRLQYDNDARYYHEQLLCVPPHERKAVLMVHDLSISTAFLFIGEK